MKTKFTEMLYSVEADSEWSSLLEWIDTPTRR